MQYSDFSIELFCPKPRVVTFTEVIEEVGGKKSIEIPPQNHAALSVQMLIVWDFIHVVSLGIRLYGHRTVYL